MKKVFSILSKNSAIAVWVCFGLVVGLGFWMVDQSRSESRKQICQSQLDQALTLRDLIDFSVGSSDNPRAVEMAQRFYQRIELPPKICVGTDIDVTKFFLRQASTTTTTTPPP